MTRYLRPVHYEATPKNCPRCRRPGLRTINDQIAECEKGHTWPITSIRTVTDKAKP